jgi:hypothetical protein
LDVQRGFPRIILAANVRAERQSTGPPVIRGRGPAPGFETMVS